MEPNMAAELLTSQQVADLLGLKKDTIEKWRRQRRGPAFVRLGGAIRYRQSAIRKFLDDQTVAPKESAA